MLQKPNSHIGTKQPQCCGGCGTAECVSCCALTSPRALVVKKDPVDRKHVVGLSEVHHDPVGVQLSSTWEESQEWQERQEIRRQKHIRTVVFGTFTQKKRDDISLYTKPNSPFKCAVTPLLTVTVHKQIFFHTLSPMLKVTWWFYWLPSTNKTFTRLSTLFNLTEWQTKQWEKQWSSLLIAAERP